MISAILSNQQNLLQAWVWAMLHSVWIGLVLAFVFYTYLGLNPRATAKTKYRVGVSLLALLPITILAAFYYSMPSAEPVNTVIAANLAPVQSTAASHVVTTGHTLPSYLSWMNGIERHVQLIFFFWSTGVILFSIRMAMGYREIFRLRSQSTSIEELPVMVMFQNLLERSGLKDKIALVSSRKVDIPITIGHLKPMILLPIGLINRLSPDETQAILAHEIAHIMRKDYLQNLFISTLEILFFYHPSVWWFSATIKAIREQCCDDLALELGAGRIALSKALIQLEEQSPGPAFALAFAHKNQLLNRIQRLFQNPSSSMKRNEYSMSRSQAPLLICGLALIWLMTNPLVGMNASMDIMRLSKSFIWDRKQIPADTVKPKSKIEKISKDNGKQKIELSLENKEIKELKVNEQLIPPAEYEKYKIETEALQKELAELDLPQRRRGVAIHSDFDSGEYDYPFNDSMHFTPRAFGWSDSKPRVFSIKPKMRFDMGDAESWGEGNDKLKRYSFRFGGNNSWNSDTKWIFEGDSSGMSVDGDKLIIKNDKGDVIIDLGDGAKRSHGFNIVKPRGAMGWSSDGSSNLYFESGAPDAVIFRKKNNEEIKNKILRDYKRAEGYYYDLDLKNKAEEEHLKSIQKRHKDISDDDEIKYIQKIRTPKAGFGGNLYALGQKSNLQEAIEEKLSRDGYLGTAKTYQFNITGKELKINGKKQDDQSYKQFKSIIKDYTGIDLEDGAMISFSGTLETKDRD